VYLAETQPLIEIYSARGLVVEIDGLGLIEEITQRILDGLSARGLGPAQ
jgi:adenylate kinase